MVQHSNRDAQMKRRERGSLHAPLIIGSADIISFLPLNSRVIFQICVMVCCILPINTITAYLDFLSPQSESVVKFKHTLRKLRAKEMDQLKQYIYIYEKILIDKLKPRQISHGPTIHFTVIVYEFICDLRRLKFLHLLSLSPLIRRKM